MLTVRIVNTNEGTNEHAHYRYTVHVNDKEIAHGSLDGHNRLYGWAALVIAIAERHLTKRALAAAKDWRKMEFDWSDVSQETPRK